MKNQIEDHKRELENAKLLYRPGSAETAKHSPPLDDPRRRKVMIALWHRMADFFGPLWESQYGTVQDQTIWAWHGVLNRFSEDELATAIRSCEDWDGKYPPTCPEFKALCMAARSASKKNFTERRMVDEPKSMIQHLTRFADSAVAKSELERMKKIMRGKSVESKDESMRKLGLHRRWS